MAAIPKTCLLASANSIGSFQGQNGRVNRAALAHGVRRVRQIGDAFVLVVGSLEEFCRKRFSIINQTGFLFFVRYNVELLS